MADLTTEMMIDKEKWTRKQLPLSGGYKALKGTTAIGRPSTGLVYPASAPAGGHASDLVLGIFAETIDNTAQTTGGATALVNVDFLKEKTILWRDNDGSITAATLFNPVYVADNHTVSTTSANTPKAGVCLGLDAALGVAFEVEGL